MKNCVSPRRRQGTSTDIQTDQGDVSSGVIPTAIKMMQANESEFYERIKHDKQPEIATALPASVPPTVTLDSLNTLSVDVDCVLSKKCETVIWLTYDNASSHIS